MSNLESSKANRTKVIESFPTKEIGKEGDIIISKIKGKGYFLCTKVGNSWYAANKLNELKRLSSPKLPELQVDSLKVNNLQIKKQPINAKISLSKGNLTLDVEGDLNFYNSDSLSADILQSDVNSGQINLYETKGTGTQHYIGLKADATMAASTVYTLPDAFPSGSSKVLQSTTAGALSWVDDNELTTEEVQDIVGTMFSSNTETRITATYEDGDGTIDLVADAAPVTALNSATENELVTVGSTTTELDAEANLTFDGTDLSIASTGKVILGAGDTYIQESGADVLDFYVGSSNILKIIEGPTNSFNINSASVTIDVAKKLIFDGSILGHTYIAESSDDVLDFYVGSKKMLALDESSSKITLSAAQVQALHTTPVELVAAPGVGKALDIMTVSAFLDYNSTPYNNVAISFKFNGMNGSTGYTTYLSSKLSDATSDAYRTSYGASANTPTNNWAFNTSFEIYTNSTLGTGDSPITIWVTYKIIDI